MDVCTQSYWKTTTTSMCVCTHFANKAHSDLIEFVILKYYSVKQLSINVEFLTGVEWRAKVTWVTPCPSFRTAAWRTTDSKPHLTVTGQPTTSRVCHLQKTVPYSRVCRMERDHLTVCVFLWMMTEHFNKGKDAGYTVNTLHLSVWCRVANDSSSTIIVVMALVFRLNLIINLTNAANSSGVELKVNGTVTLVRAGCVLAVTINTADGIKTLVHVWYHNNRNDHCVRWRTAVDVLL